MAAVAQARQAAEEQLRAAKELTSACLREMFDDELALKYPKKMLTDVCRDISDGTHFTPTYIPQGIPFLSVKDVKEAGISFESCRYINEEQHRALIKRSNLNAAMYFIQKSAQQVLQKPLMLTANSVFLLASLFSNSDRISFHQNILKRRSIPHFAEFKRKN